MVAFKATVVAPRAGVVDETWGGVVSGILTVSLPHPAVSTIMSAAKNRTISRRGVRIFVPSWDCCDVRPYTFWLSALSRGHISHLGATKLHNCFHSRYLPDRRKPGCRQPDCHGVAEVAGRRDMGPHPGWGSKNLLRQAAVVTRRRGKSALHVHDCSGDRMPRAFFDLQRSPLGRRGWLMVRNFPWSEACSPNHTMAAGK